MEKNDLQAEQSAQITPDFHLIVVHPFGTYSKGAHLSDAAEIAAVLAGENAGSCNRIAVAA